MSSDSVAFVITTFNRRELLDRAVQTVLPQLQPQDRLIILDDCSVDDTKAYADELMTQNDQLIYFCQAKNSGVNAARQQAIKVAQDTPCAWISYIDDDDYLTDDARELFTKALSETLEAKWIAFAAIDPQGQQLSTFPASGKYSYIEDYMGHRTVKGDYQHFLHMDIAQQCTFTTQFKNAEVWYFWCQVSALTPMFIESTPGVVKEFLEEGITKSGFNREKQLEVAQLKVDSLRGKMSDAQYSKILRNLGKAYLKNKNKKQARVYLKQAISLNPSLFSAYKYLIQAL